MLWLVMSLPLEQGAESMSPALTENAVVSRKEIEVLLPKEREFNVARVRVNFPSETNSRIPYGDLSWTLKVKLD